MELTLTGGKQMHKWLWLGLIVVPVILLSGCGGSSSNLVVGEGTGIVAADGFDPFGGDHGPIQLKYFTFPATGTYQLTISSGPDQPALPNPWVMLFDGHVAATNVAFLGAYDSGNGVLAQSHGANIAHVVVQANSGDTFTFAVSSWTNGNGAYSWRLDPL